MLERAVEHSENTFCNVVDVSSNHANNENVIDRVFRAIVCFKFGF